MAGDPTNEIDPNILAGEIEADSRSLWSFHRGISPVIATAIHNGHGVRPELKDRYALSAEQRLREEDPFTEYMIRDVPNRVIFHRSRFEIDLNRDRDAAVYLRPEQAWGLTVWRSSLPAEMIERSLAIHEDYYEALRTYLESIERQFGRFVVLDVHSYNHRRDGPNAKPTEPTEAPEINIGTYSMDRRRWAPIVDTLISHLKGFSIDGRRFEVQENVAFQGKGEQTRFIHTRFPRTGCAIAIEFKKIFMDEWTGEPDPVTLRQIRLLIASCVQVMENALGANS